MAKLPRAGVSSFTIDGVPYDVVSDVSWAPNMLVRSTLMGLTGVQGFSATPSQGKISVTIRDDGGISVADFIAMTDVTVLIAQRNGKRIVGTGMWVVDAIEVNSAEGTFAVTFEGPDVVEIA